MPRQSKRASEVEALLDPRVQMELAISIPGFDRTGFLTSLLDVWGGQDRLAGDLYLEFQNAPKGSMVRQRILELIVRMIGQHSDSERTVPIDELDDVGLSEAILHFAGVVKTKIGVPDGPAAG